jgi:hypothetical protein
MLEALPYRVWHGEHLHGGGLAILVHPRRAASKATSVRCLPGRHLLCLTYPLQQTFHLSIVNMHLPPSLAHPDRRSTCAAAAQFLRTTRPGAQLICGDLNEWPRVAGGGWLSKSLSPSGTWAGYRSPYPAGEATNYVSTARGTSAKELDWVFVSPTTPCTACTKVLLPGLSTHKGLQVDLTIPSALLTPLDPSGKQFRFRQATPTQLEDAAEIVSLYLHWAEAARLEPDTALRLCWDGLRGYIPTAHKRTQVRHEDATLADAELSAHKPML